MVKTEIYEELLSSKVLTIKQLPLNNEKPYSFAINKILSNAELFDNITLLAENYIKTKDLKFNKLCAISTSAIPYATNIATSFEKGFFYIDSNGHNVNEQGNVSHLKIEGEMEIDDNIIIVETVVRKDYLIDNIITKLRKFGGNVVGVLIILDTCEGEFARLIDAKETIMKVMTIYDIFGYLENNNKIDMFASEKLKFYCEKETKIAIHKIAEAKEAKLPAVEAVVVPDVMEANIAADKQIFVSQ